MSSAKSENKMDEHSSIRFTPSGMEVDLEKYLRTGHGRYLLHRLAERERDRLAQKAEEDGVELLPLGPHDHPEPNSNYWDTLELSAIRQYAAACVVADRLSRARSNGVTYES